MSETQQSLYEREHARGLHQHWACPGCALCPPVPAPQIVVPIESQAPPTPAEQRRQHGFSSLGEAIERLRARGLAFKVTDPDRPALPDGPPDGGPECELCGGFRRLRRDVPVQHPDFGKSFDCPKCFQGFLLQQRLDRLIGELPTRYRDWTLDSFPQRAPGHKQVVRLAQEWLNDDNRPWMLAIGRSGRGKTGLAVGLLKASLERRRTGTFKDVDLLLARIRSTWHNKANFDADESAIMSALNSADLLVLDDLGRENDRDWASELLTQLIALRHEEQRQTIITSNWSIDELAERIGYPSARRISEAAGRYQLDFSKLPNLTENSAA